MHQVADLPADGLLPGRRGVDVGIDTPVSGVCQNGFEWLGQRLAN